MKEVWKPIKGFEGLYEVSSIGRVRSLNYRQTGKSKELAFEEVGGYLRVSLSKKGEARFRPLVHRLVAEAFLPNLNEYPQVNHIDEDRANNYVNNLEWCSAKYNINHGTAIQRRSKPIEAVDPASGEIIYSFHSSKEAGRNGFDGSHIISCCKGKRKTHKGLVWRYKEDSYEN